MCYIDFKSESYRDESVATSEFRIRPTNSTLRMFEDLPLVKLNAKIIFFLCIP